MERLCPCCGDTKSKPAPIEAGLCRGLRPRSPIGTTNALAHGNFQQSADVRPAPNLHSRGSNDTTGRDRNPCSSRSTPPFPIMRLSLSATKAPIRKSGVRPQPPAPHRSHHIQEFEPRAGRHRDRRFRISCRKTHQPTLRRCRFDTNEVSRSLRTPFIRQLQSLDIGSCHHRQTRWPQ
jgi:hypothetical protein